MTAKDGRRYSTVDEIKRDMDEATTDRERSMIYRNAVKSPIGRTPEAMELFTRSGDES